MIEKILHYLKGTRLVGTEYLLEELHTEHYTKERKMPLCLYAAMHLDGSCMENVSTNHINAVMNLIDVKTGQKVLGFYKYAGKPVSYDIVSGPTELNNEALRRNEEETVRIYENLKSAEGSIVRITGWLNNSKIFAESITN